MQAMLPFLYVILIGAAAGIVAKFLMPGREGGGLVVTVVLAVAGAMLVAYLGQWMGFYRVGQPMGYVGAVMGGAILAAIFRFSQR